jgi:hypothetical protein
MGGEGSGVGLKMARLETKVPSFDGRFGVGLFVNTRRNAEQRRQVALGHVPKVLREAIEIQICPYNTNREDGFCLSKSWKPLIGSVRLSGHDPRTLGDAFQACIYSAKYARATSMQRGRGVSCRV